MAPARIKLPRLFAAIPAPRLFGWVKDQEHKQRQGRALSEMTDTQLRDIGISRTEAEREAIALGWDAPAHWKRGPGTQNW